MRTKTSVDLAQELMNEFARITGLDPVSSKPKRYLWTDAFAVCNYLELYRQREDRKWLMLALQLVDQVHQTLGRHREDDPRTGWISGLDEDEGRKHPTIGGLRIGKELNERRKGEPSDPNLEWEQDGQYFHYLTKWMHALNCVAGVTGEKQYLIWAIEMAKTVASAFIYNSSSNQSRMYWKMSIDLSYPLVTSMGQHDPLDGWVTIRELEESSKRIGISIDLRTEVERMERICHVTSRGGGLVTDDSLGVGGLLFDALRLAQMHSQAKSAIRKVLDSAKIGLDYFSASGSFSLPAEYRLAFRELGLSIGLRGVELAMEGAIPLDQESKEMISSLGSFIPMAEKIEGYWTNDLNRDASTWNDHKEINMVMLATSLEPARFIKI